MTEMCMLVVMKRDRENMLLQRWFCGGMSGLVL